MGKVIKSKIQGIGWKARISLVLLLTLVTSVFMYEGLYKPRPVEAAPTAQATWAQKYAGATYPAGNLSTTQTVNAGTNRLLVVAIASTSTAAAAQTVSNVTWNGTALTLAAGDGANSANPNHTYLYYLKDANMPAAATTAAITATITGGTSYYTYIYARVYDGVDQTTPFTDAKNVNAAGTGDTTLGPFSPALNIAANDQAIMIANTARTSAGTTARTISGQSDTSWSTATVATSFATTSGPTIGLAIRDRNTTTASTTPSTFTVSNTAWDSMTAMSIKAPGAGGTGGSVQLTASTNSVSEAAGTLTLTVTRTGGSTGAASVNYATAGVTALAGSDFTATSGTLNWADGDATSKTITVPIINDTYNEPDETFTVTLSSPSVVTLGSPSATTVTIVDDDATPTVQFQSAASSGSETTSPAAITVTLSAASGRDVTVNYATANVTATAGLDYTATSGTLTIPALSTTGTINVPILTDAVTDPNETFTITLSAPTNATLGGITLHTRTITEPVGSVINSCTGCHGNPPVDGTSRNNPAGQFQGTHNTHTGSAVGQYGYACSDCHVQPGSTAFNHANGVINMANPLHGETGAAYNKSGSPNIPVSNAAFSGSTCTNLYCHSDGTGGTTQSGDNRAKGSPVVTPTWGGTALDCSGCHTGGTTTGPTYTTGKANSHNAHTKAGVAYGCDVCHYATTTSGTAVTDATKHVNKVYDVSANTAKTAAFTYAYNSTGGTCDNSSCHGAGVPKWGTNTTAPQCQKCHGSKTAAFATVSSAQVAPGYSTDGQDTGGNTAATAARVGTHQGHLTAATGISGPIKCSECHVKVNAVADAGHLNYTTATISFGGRATAQSHTTASVSRVSGVIQCNNTYCHTGKLNTGAAMAPAFNNTTYLSTSMTITDCTRCHAMPPNPGVAGTHQSIPSALTGFPATSCGCHTNLSSTGTTFANIFADKKLHINGIIEGGDCVSCHSSVQNTVRRIITGASGDFVKASHHVTNGTTTQIVNVNACIVCHGDLLASRSHPNGLPADPQVDLVDPDTGAFVANTVAGVEQVCAACHDANGATRTGLPSGSTATQPFNTAGDTGSPVNLGWTAGVMAHSANNGCLNCHDNGHGNVNAKMVRFAYNVADTVSTATNFCYNCHGTTVANGAVDAIKASFDTTNGHNTIKCQDCHEQHQAKAYSNTKGSATLNPVLNGVPGKSATWSAASAWPSTSNATYTTNTATADWHICFKCHAGTGFVAGGTAAAAMTDLGLEFNTNNQSFHPVAAALPTTGNRRLATTALAGGWTPGMVMKCSDCHGNDTGATRGPHGSSVKWMLKPNTTGTVYYNWPYTTAAGNGTSTGTLVNGTGSSTAPSGGVFCLSCHVWSGGGQAHTAQGSSHGRACVGCHIRVPHGGKALRLLTGPNAPGRYKPDGNAGGTIYMNGGSRPASGVMGGSNCQSASGCTEHAASGTLLGW